jgi:uncharacterized protein
MKSILLISAWLLTTIAIAQITDTVYIDVDKTKLHTVLTRPSNTANYPIVIIVAGSGPTDLNGNNPMMQNNSLKFLSDGLVKNSIATLRYDKRAIAKSAVPYFNEADLTIDTYANDLIKFVEYASSSGHQQIFIAGHSEGSLIGLIALQQKAVNGFISIAGAGHPADEILKSQLKPQLPPAMFTRVENMLDSLKAGHIIPEPPAMLNMLFRQSIQPYLISWFKYDPAQLIQNINLPTIIIQGGNDIQIKEEDAQRLAGAINTAPVIINDMNHILKIINGSIQENMASYNNPELPVSEELVQTIVEFLST